MIYRDETNQYLPALSTSSFNPIYQLGCHKNYTFSLLKAQAEPYGTNYKMCSTKVANNAALYIAGMHSYPWLDTLPCWIPVIYNYNYPNGVIDLPNPGYVQRIVVVNWPAVFGLYNVPRWNPSQSGHRFRWSAMLACGRACALSVFHYEEYCMYA